MIGIDGHTSDDGSDSFCAHKSKCLPINWCKENRVSLKVPEKWEGTRFSYANYLKSEKAIAAPLSLFEKEKEEINGFKKGMHVEAVDVVEPHLICPGIGGRLNCSAGSQHSDCLILRICIASFQTSQTGSWIADQDQFCWLG